jgi:hypothetical protein
MRCGKLAAVFERFTDRARRVLVLAQQEALGLGHGYIGTEHLLLGLLAEKEGVAAKALESLGVDIAALRAKLGKAVGPSGTEPTGSPPLTPRAKKVLELALREALGMGHQYIGTEHLLLGIAREGSGTAVQVLTQLGAPPERVRPAVTSLLGGPATLSTERVTGTLLRPAPQGRQRSAWWWSVGRPLSGPLGVGMSGPAGSRSGSYVDGAVALDHDGGRLSGTVAGQEVYLSLPLPASAGEVAGSFAGAAVTGSWRLGRAGDWAPELPGRLGGYFGGDELEVRGWFRLERGMVFDFAEFEGLCGGTPVSAFARAATPGLPDGSVLLGGFLAGAGFSMKREVAAQGSSLCGAVDGHAFALRAERSGDGRLAITGDFSGPGLLLALVAACLAYFG